MENTISIVIRAKDDFSKSLKQAADQIDGFGDRVARAGERMQRIGMSMVAFSAPFIAGLTGASRSFMEFDKAMTNARAVLGTTREEMVGVNNEIRELAEVSQAGPQALIEAYYEVVSGVMDTSTHMAILEAAMKTSEAGAADLGGTTSALISVMNAYGFSAEQASFASDVLTRTVGMGVGSMQDFAASLPKVTSLAAQLGIGFEQVGAMEAYLTTKGYTAAESATALTQAMVALLNPNKAMKDALEALGVESGSAAIAQYGLAGSFQRMYQQMGGSTDQMIAAVGSVEAMRAVLGVTGDEFTQFSQTFIEGVAGATDAAREIQLDSLAADMNLLSSQVKLLGIDIGEALEPVLRTVAQELKKVVNEISGFIRANPELVRIVAIAAVGIGALGTVLTAVGFILPALTAGIHVFSGALSFLAAHPIVLAVAGVALLLAYLTDFGGIRTKVQQALEGVGAELHLFAFRAQYILNQIGQFLDNIFSGRMTLDEAIAELVGPDVVEQVGSLNIKIGMLAVVAGVAGVGLFALNLIMAGFHTVVGLARGAVTLFTTSALAPLLPLLLVVGGLVLAYQNNWLGWRDTVDKARLAFDNLIGILGHLKDNAPVVFGAVRAEIQAMIDKVVKEGIPAVKQMRDAFLELGEESAKNLDRDWEVGGWLPPGSSPGTIGLRANGGPVVAGAPYIVGERGPEMFIPSSSGRIAPNSELGGSVSYTINVMMPAAAMASPGAARLAGQEFGDQIARRIRERG